MNPSGFIAGRLRFRGTMATVSIAVSFLVMIVAVAVSSGFRHTLRDGVSQFMGDVQLSGQAPLPDSLSFDVTSLRGVEECVAAVYRAGIVRSGDIIQGIMVKGIPRDSSWAPLGVSIPASLSSVTGLGPGDTMQTWFVGDNVKVRNFRVVSVMDDMPELRDYMLVYAGLQDMQRLEGWGPHDVSVLELRAAGGWKGGKRLAALAGEVGARLLASPVEAERSIVTQSSVQRFPQLFNWLDLLDFNVLFILVLMTLVAGFNMISGLLILLFRNISTIGILKTLGMTDRSIAAVFMKMASVLVLRGLVIGNAAALLLCLIQGGTHLFRLNPTNYFVSYVPVHVDIALILAADAAALCVILLLLLLPTLMISRVDPAQTVRVS